MSINHWKSRLCTTGGIWTYKLPCHIAADLNRTVDASSPGLGASFSLASGKRQRELGSSEQTQQESNPGPGEFHVSPRWTISVGSVGAT
jgi:hypothetical protein